MPPLTFYQTDIYLLGLHVTLLTSNTLILLHFENSTTDKCTTDFIFAEIFELSTATCCNWNFVLKYEKDVLLIRPLWRHLKYIFIRYVFHHQCTILKKKFPTLTYPTISRRFCIKRQIIRNIKMRFWFNETSSEICQQWPQVPTL